MGSILEPIIGRALDGWLTDNFSWRWVFYINIPIGVMACIGLSIFLTESRTSAKAGSTASGSARLR